MKNLLLTVLCIFVALNFARTQNAVGISYRHCSGCTGSQSLTAALTNYDANHVDWEVDDVVSDFDKRNVSSGNRWHSGVDLRDWATGNTHIGDAIIAPENGTVTLIKDGSYKVLVVDDVNYDFGYGHIFTSSTSYPYRTGNFVLARVKRDPVIDGTGNPPLAIVNLNTCTAYCAQAGREVVINSLINCGNSIMTTNQVATNECFSPLIAQTRLQIKNCNFHHGKTHIYHRAEASHPQRGG